MATASHRGKVLRFTADRFTVGYVLAMFALQLGLWAQESLLVAGLAAPVVWVLLLLCAPMNHNHQHVNVFHSRVLNRLFELPLSLQTGMAPYAWVLHHNLGHHLNYLQQYPGTDVDESRWTRPSGAQMGRLEYTLRLFLSHPIDIFRVGRQHPRVYSKYLWMKLPLYALIATLLWLHPAQFLILFVATPAAILLHTCWVTYEHHAGLRAETHELASRNRTSKLYNLLSQNLGYHTAHHMRPGLHWSLLPDFHAQVQKKIPTGQVNPAFW